MNVNTCIPYFRVCRDETWCERRKHWVNYRTYNTSSIFSNNIKYLPITWINPWHSSEVRNKQVDKYGNNVVESVNDYDEYSRNCVLQLVSFRMIRFVYLTIGFFFFFKNKTFGEVIRNNWSEIGYRTQTGECRKNMSTN